MMNRHLLSKTAVLLVFQTGVD